MIGIVSPALAVEVTIEIQNDEVIRTCFHPGGQGVHVARVVAELGESCRLVGFNGGESGVVLSALLADVGIPGYLIPCHHSTAAVFKITSDYATQMIYQTLPPKVSRHEVDDLYGAASILLFEVGVLVINGSLPKGMPLEIVDKLIRQAHAHQVPCVLDVAGKELLAVIQAAPSLVKPNIEQLRPFFDISANPDDQEVLAIAKQLRSLGAQKVVISLDVRGAIALSEGEAFRVNAPHVEAVGGPGAGDSMVAAMAVGVTQNLSFEQMLRLGAAAGSANVLRHGMGTAKRTLIERLTGLVEIIPLEG